MEESIEVTLVLTVVVFHNLWRVSQIVFGHIVLILELFMHLCTELSEVPCTINYML